MGEREGSDTPLLFLITITAKVFDIFLQPLNLQEVLSEKFTHAKSNQVANLK